MREKTFCHFCGNRLIRKEWEGRLRGFCETCNEPLYENPIPATCLIVTDETGNLLLVRRSVAPKKGFWCLPGGYMELGEEPEEAALRELKEETGLSGRIDHLVGVAASSNAIYGTVALICYAVTAYEGTMMPGDDAAEVAFFSVDRLPEIAFESHRRFIRHHRRTGPAAQPAGEDKVSRR